MNMNDPDTGVRRARARKSDPFTSHAAAAVVTRSLPTIRAAVLAILEAAEGPMTHDQIIAAYGRATMNGQARRTGPSSIRTRCNELERDELVIAVPDGLGRSSYGNPARLYVARSVYKEETDRKEQGVLL